MSSSRVTSANVRSSDGSMFVSPPGGRTSSSVDLEKIRCAWEDLALKVPMQSHMWTRACIEAFPSPTLKLVTAGSNKLHGVAPLVEASDDRILVPLGTELYEPTEFAYTDADAAFELSESIVRLKRAVLIPDMFADSMIVEGLRRVAGRRLVIQPTCGHPWLELDDTWLQPESHLNPGRRSDVRRAWRNAEKLGNVRCEILTPTPASLAPLLEDAFKVESAGWKGARGSSLAADTQVGGFYRRFAESACEAGILRLGFLHIGDHVVAMQIGVEQDGCFWLFKMGFDESFARYSPGMLLMIESLRCARQRGCHRYELMGKSEAWNQVWMPQIHAAVVVKLCAPTIRGWVSVLREITKGKVKTHLRG